ncbi:MAG: DUF4491 family protein [Alistipes sp.]|jgi:hypothetical protein|nr:DUF4491 family protein [Alistipes sp.]
MSFIESYNLTGVVIGLGTFAIIGMFHPIVIRGEYHFGVRVWWVFLVAGLAALAGAVVVRGVVGSALLGVTGFTCLWSIHEVFAQRTRVAKGWFPNNPRRQLRKPR